MKRGNSPDKVKSDLVELYDKSAESYDLEYQTSAGRYFMMGKIKTALDLGGFNKGDNILEVGCANGVYTFEFARMGFDMTGLDLSPKNIEVAKERAKKMNINNVKFLVGDAERLSMFSDNTFDGAISFSTLRYVPNPQKAINEIYRVIKKGKSAVVDFPNKRSPWFNYLKPLLTGETHIHDNQYSTSECKMFLKNAVFRDVKAKRILYTPKSTPSYLLGVMKVVDFIGERMPVINEFAAIIMCRGIK